MNINVYSFKICIFFLSLLTINRSGKHSDYHYYSDYNSHISHPDYGPYERIHYRIPEYYANKIKKKIRQASVTYSDTELFADILNPKMTWAKILNRVQSAAGKLKTNFRDWRRTTCPDANCQSCLNSCNHIKNADSVKEPFTQFLYLTLCAEGCKRSIECFTDKYCLPVMEENPEYFIFCVNNCPIFPVIPFIFVA